MKPTIYDIAKTANVSKSTVSRVLNKQTNISEDAKRRVLAAIEQLQYEPSKIARGLSGSGFDGIMALSNRSSHTTLGNPFFSDIIQSISIQAENRNFDLILQTAKNAEDSLLKCQAKIREKLIKGIILLSSPMDESFLYELDTYNVPVVVIGKVDGDFQNIFSVDTDNFNDSYLLTKVLIDNGHEKIACLHAPLDVHVSIDRLTGYRKCLYDHGLDIRNDWIIDGGYTLDNNIEGAKKILDNSEPPTAVFTSDALKSLSIYRVAAKLGLKTPDNISIIGFNDHTFSPFFSPKLSGIEIPTYDLGEQATTLLFNLIDKKNDFPKKTILPTTIELNQSIIDLS